MRTAPTLTWEERVERLSRSHLHVVSPTGELWPISAFRLQRTYDDGDNVSVPLQDALMHPIVHEGHRPDLVRVSIRADRNTVGRFFVSGRDHWGREHNIAADSRASAERMRERIRAGEEIRMEDYRIRD